MNRVFRIAVTTVFFLWLFPHWMYSCGPFYSYAVFTYQSHPDFPLKNYAAGEIGVPQPTYARSYLVVAYRYYRGVPLNAAEQAAAWQLWAFRMAHSWPELDSDRWLKARKLVPGVQSTNVVSIKWMGVQGYLSCSIDAFETAADTLKARIQHYGASSPEVRDWLAAQDTVFAYCGDPPGQEKAGEVRARTLARVEEAPSNAPVWVKADRAYQVAAMNFYDQHFDIARQQFEKIAADPSSPWRTLAPYLAARAMIRKATLMAPDGKDFDEAVLRDAEAMLQRILDNPKLKSVHKKARLLRGFVEFRLHPEPRTHELAKRLLHPGTIDSMGEELDEYTRLLDKFLGWSTDNDPDENRRQTELSKKAAVFRRLRQDDLTDWIFAFQTERAHEDPHAIARWRATKSVAWLVAALTHEGGSDRSVNELIQAAAEVPRDSAAYLAAQFHMARLRAETGQVEQARQSIDALLAAGEPAMPTSARNQFFALRMHLAGTARELLQYSTRQPVGITDEDEPEISRDFYRDSTTRPITAIDFSGLSKDTPKVLFDRDFGDVWARALPLNLSASFVADASLPENMRQRLAMATFTRAIVLKNDTIGKDTAAQLSLLIPKLERYMQDYRMAADAEEAHFAGIFSVLHFPGMRPVLATGLGRSEPIHSIDDYRDNWWCPLTDVVDSNEPAYPGEYRDSALAAVKPTYPVFLSDEEKSQAAEEWKAVKVASPSANYLGRQVLAWAQGHRDDPRVPEALHLAVRTARYGCNDEQTPRVTRACFRFLHQHYPRSEWTKKTATWAAD